MRTMLIRVAIVVFVFMLSLPLAQAQEEDGGIGPGNRQVGLGVIAGAMFPFKNKYNYKITESYGFYVDIPVISTFHISPQTILYRLDYKGGDNKSAWDSDAEPPDNAGITDISINFKFVIPLPGWKIFIAALMGVSNGHFIEDDQVQFHAGGSFGFSYRVISNLDLLLMGQYKYLVDGDQGGGLHMVHGMGGLQFNF